MSLVNRMPWTQFQIDAEVDAFGTARIVAAANQLFDERRAAAVESRTRCCNCIHSALSHEVDDEERRECKVHCCSCEQYVSGDEY